jgi:hypothetical protein
MQENEVIIVDQIEDEKYHSLVKKSVEYAIISLPFTVDRMRIPNENRRALNIAKGKVAESLFQHFCKINRIEVDFATPSTPFWTVDKRDFLMNNSEWDLKNNFIYLKGDYLTQYRYIDLPALVPNVREGDQWSKRNELLFDHSIRADFLFTFLKNADLQQKKRGKPFIEIQLTNDQISFLRKLYKKYKGQPQEQAPFSEDAFWKEMAKHGNLNFYQLRFKPGLVITGYANSNHWHLFRNIGPYEQNCYFKDYKTPHWYVKNKKGSCNFLEDTLWTRITNAVTPVSNLPAFSSLFPQLKEQMKGGRFIDKFRSRGKL